MHVWVVFHLFILGLLYLDLKVFRRQAEEVKTKEALGWSAFWIGLSLCFNVFVFFYKGKEAALQFFTGYLVEKSLSVDNLFVFFLIFSYFKIPKKYQYKALFSGILGALILRLLFILGGTKLIGEFQWLIALLGFFLCVTGVKLYFQRERLKIKDNFLVRLCRTFFPVTEDFAGGKFFVRRQGILYITPLFLAVVALEASDIVFALDSIPAIFAITLDPFIAYTSNVFAILGLRALHLALTNFYDRFHYLKLGLSLILVFIGAKMVLSLTYEIPLLASLGVILSISTFSILASFLKKR